MKTYSMRRNSGQAMITAIIILLAIAFIVVGNSMRLVIGESFRVRGATDSERSYYLAESALEDTVFRMKNQHPVSASESVLVGSLSALAGFRSVGGVDYIYATSTAFNATRILGASMYRGEGVDFFYGIHVGETGVQLSNNAIVNGNIFTNGSAVGENGSRINGSAFAVGTISTPSPLVTGTQQNGVDPIPLPPIDIEYWKAAANVNNDPYSGNLSYSGTSNFLGPRKVEGSVSLSNGAVLTVRGPLHITGNLSLDNNAIIKLDESFGSEGTMVLVDGTIDIRNNSSVLATTANPKGYILLVTTAPGSAVTLNNNADTQTLVYAMNGTVAIENNGSALAIVAQGLTLSNNAEINYEAGLQDARFSSGPSGGWEIDGWGEME